MKVNFIYKHIYYMTIFSILLIYIAQSTDLSIGEGWSEILRDSLFVLQVTTIWLGPTFTILNPISKVRLATSTHITVFINRTNLALEGESFFR